MPSIQTTALAALLTVAPMAVAQIPVQPISIVQSFCDTNKDFQFDGSGSPVGPVMNYTLCIDVTQKAFAMICTKDQPCPGGPQSAHQVYTNGVAYIVDYEGKCVKKPCPNRAQCDPPDAIPFSFLLLDDDSRGVATRVGSTTIDGLAVDQWTHRRSPTQVMNWYVRNLSTSADEPKQLVRNTFNHTDQGGGSGNRDFSKNWVTPAPKGTFAIPKGCANAPEMKEDLVLFGQVFGSMYGDRY